MRNQDLNPHDIGPTNKEHSKDHNGNGMPRLLEVLTQEKIDKIFVNN